VPLALLYPPLAIVSTAAGWLIIVAIIAAVLAFAYLAFGPAALGLPSWIVVLAVLAALSIPWSMAVRLIAAAVGGLLVFLVIGFAMVLRTRPPGSSGRDGDSAATPAGETKPDPAPGGEN